MAPPVLRYGRQTIDEDDVAAVLRVLRGDFLTGGPAVEGFEAALAARTGAAHAVACSNGTTALHLAAIAVGLGPGDVAIVPSVTFLATANAVRMQGAAVCFADVDPETGLLTPETLERALPAAAGMGRVRAVLPVHLAGQAADMPAIAEVARRQGLAVIEDAAHALGTRTPGGEVGRCLHSDLTTFSFHPVKTVTMGEGGAVTTNDAGLARRIRSLRSHGMVRAADGFRIADQAFDPATGEPNPWYYEMQELGYNYRVCDISCALGESQLAKLDRFAARRAALVARYDGALAGLDWLRPLGRLPGQQPCWHLYVALFDFAAMGLTRAQVMQRLRAQGIETQVHYLPVHRQPYYRGLYGLADLPGADAYYARCLSLPLFPAMTDEDADRVVAAIRSLDR